MERRSGRQIGESNEFDARWHWQSAFRSGSKAIKRTAVGTVLVGACCGRISILLGFLLSASCAWSADDADPASWSWNNPKDLGIAGLQHRTFESHSMDRMIGYQIYLPPQHDQEPDRRFPVVYFLHGAGGNESSDAGLAARVAAEIKGGRIAPVIYVFPNGGKRSGYRDSKTNYVRAETMLTRELIPLIDREFQTVNEPSGRAVCGFSMGGGGAVRLALKRPELFGAVASLAAALERSSDASGGDNCYVHAAGLTVDQRESMHMYFVVGDEDFLYPRHGPFMTHLKALGIRYTLVVHTDVEHNLGTLNRLSADSMIRHLDRQLRSNR